MEKYRYNPKPPFEKRMNELLRDEKDKEEYWKIVHTLPVISIRCNTIKIKPDELKKRLEDKGWKLKIPYENHPEIIIIKNKLNPGELGKTKEHLLGYYYVQELASMMPLLSLQPTKEDSLFDCCASPGSKTTQAASMMNNKGIIFANDNKLGRMMILVANLEKNSVSNTIITKKDAAQLCKKLYNEDLRFDKILADAPCSGEGTLRSSPVTFRMWNPKMIEKFSRTQKLIASSALKILKVGGEMIYSTCTHAPEENEIVVQHLLDNFDIELQEINLPIKTRPGISEWNGKKFDKQIEKCARIYPQDNNTEGFFICKLKKLSDKLPEIVENFNLARVGVLGIYNSKKPAAGLS